VRKKFRSRMADTFSGGPATPSLNNNGGGRGAGAGAGSGSGSGSGSGDNAYLAAMSAFKSKACGGDGDHVRPLMK
jgi:hypothetical protein